MTKLNCWDVLQCGRQEGGVNTAELGVCPASLAEKFDGVNQGQRAGRFCWAVDETLCFGEIQGTIADKALSCMQCDFYQLVVSEERAHLIINPTQLLST